MLIRGIRSRYEQNDFVKQCGSLLVPDAEATILAIDRLLALARASRMPVAPLISLR